MSTVINNIQRLLPVINKFPNLGSIQVADHDDVGETFGQLQNDDIVIYSDFTADECTEEERDRLVDWYNSQVFDDLNLMMARLGYVFADESDGSGGGLYYGCILYRKAS